MIEGEPNIPAQRTRHPSGGAAQAVVLLALSLSVSACLCSWSKRQAFEASLKCNMTAGAVETLAERYGARNFGPNTDRESWLQPAEYHLSKGATGIRFWFFEGQLRAYQQSRRYGLMGIEMSAPQEPCAASRSGTAVVMQIDAPLEFAGGFIYLDGMTVGDLSSLEGFAPRGAVIELYGLSPGEHEIAVENGRSAPLRRRFTYVPAAAWPDRDHIQIELTEAENGVA